MFKIITTSLLTIPRFYGSHCTCYFKNQATKSIIKIFRLFLFFTLRNFQRKLVSSILQVKMQKNKFLQTDLYFRTFVFSVQNIDDSCSLPNSDCYCLDRVRRRRAPRRYVHASLHSHHSSLSYYCQV